MGPWIVSPFKKDEDQDSERPVLEASTSGMAIGGTGHRDGHTVGECS